MSIWLSGVEAEAYLGVSRTTLHRYRRAGKLVGYRIGGNRLVRYRREDLDALVERDDVGGRAADAQEEGPVTSSDQRGCFNLGRNGAARPGTDRSVVEQKKAARPP